MDDLEEFLVNVRADIETALGHLLPAETEEPSRLHSAIRWSVFAGGKRVRPAIVFAAGEVFGVERNKLINTAAAIEMIHTYSLIHDDLPAMDDDDLRRGKPTCHKQFGEATAILAGDVLQTLAFKAVADDSTLSAETRVQLISVIASASGTPDGMVAGQQMDLDAEGELLSLDDIRTIHRGKTGALIRAAALAGAIIGDATPSERRTITEYADRLGLLFQVTDDLLDVTQSTEGLGKTAGKDAAVSKGTYPSILGIDETRTAVRSICDEACAALTTIDRNTSMLAALAKHIANRTK